MKPDAKNLSFRMLVLIATPKLTGQAEKLFKEGAVPVYHRLVAKGTASSHMMDILGFGGVDKAMLLSFMPKPFAEEMLRKFQGNLKLGTVNSGIAFTIPLSGMNTLMMRMIQQMDVENTEQQERKEEAMADIKYTLIAAIVNQGYSDEVADAARAVGAKGGTVLHSRRVGNEQAMNFWGLSVQEEKEIVLIVADSESKLKIMKAIGEKCGIRSEANGIVMSVPVDSVIGLGES